MSIYSKDLILIVWVVAAIGCLIMKKIQPESFRLYAVYVLVICVLIAVYSNILVLMG